MNIQTTFEKLKKKNQAALILYMTAGYPEMETSMKNIQKMAESGADVIEIGIPFSDPIADGTLIQYASQTALQNPINLSSIIENISKLNVDVPLVVMSYANPLLAYGLERLFPDFSEAGVSGMIVPDLPVEEAETWMSLSQENNIELIFLAAPTSSVGRIQKIVDASRGFVYCVSLKGTTGVRQGLPDDVLDFLKRVRKITKKPLGVGFGISTPQHIILLKDYVDGVIIGSRLIQAVRDGEDLSTIVSHLKNATKE